MILDNSSKYASDIIESITECLVSCTHKVEIYGTIVAILNSRNSEFADDLMSNFMEVIEEILRKGETPKIQSVFLSLCVLCSLRVLTEESVMALFERAVDTIADSHFDQMRTEFYCYSVLSAFLFSKRKFIGMDQLVSRIEGYISTRQESHKDVVRLLSSFSEENDCLFQLNEIVKTLIESDWQCPIFLNCHFMFEDEMKGSKVHALKDLMIPSVNAGIQYPVLTQNMFFMEENPVAGDSYYPSGSARWIVVSQIQHAIRTFEGNHKVCVDEIVTLKTSCEFHLSKAIVEAVFIEMFRLPESEYKLPYYTVLIVDLCKTQPQFPKHLGAAIRFFFDNLDRLNIALVERFSLWFSHHLTNFSFHWPWKFWESVLEVETESIQKLFLCDLMKNLVKLSYFDRVVKEIPESFHIFLPVKPEPTFKQSDADLALIANLTENMRSKNAIDFGSLLKVDGVISTTNRDLFLFALLEVGSKTFSHCLNTIEKYLGLLQSMNKTEEEAKLTLDSIHEFWQNDSQFYSITIIKFMNYRILEPFWVVRWLLSNSNDTFEYWRLLNTAVDKMFSVNSEAVSKIDQSEVEDCFRLLIESILQSENIFTLSFIVRIAFKYPRLVAKYIPSDSPISSIFAYLRIE